MTLIEVPTDVGLESMLWDVVHDLQAVIRLESVNPPGNELPVARYVHDLLHRQGVASRLLEPAPGRGAVIARIPGTGPEPPLLLMAHMDVVGVEREKWRTPPFGGEVLDGYVYGRGAIDDKGMLVTNLHTILWLRRLVTAGARPSRDVIFLATSDEEAGGELGIDWVLEHHRDDIAAGVALNEGGRIRVVDGVPAYAAVQCAEKVPHNVRVTARGAGGHAAIPHGDNAILRLAHALARIGAHREPLVLQDVTRGFFSALAAATPDADLRSAMRDLVSGEGDREQRGAEGLRVVPSFDAVLRNGISPTILEGGTRSNVIPTEASVTLNIRTMPGESIGALVERLRGCIDDPGVELSVTSSGIDAPSSSPETREFAAIRDAIQSVHPGLPVAPYLSTGATDSATLRAAGIPCYGLLPFPLTQDDEDRMHGHDERVRVDALSTGLAVTCGIVARLVA